MLSKLIYFALMLLSSPFMIAMHEDADQFIFPDSFFPYNTPSDTKLNDIFKDFHQEILKNRNNTQKLNILLKTENTLRPLSAYLLSQSSMDELRENVELESTIYCFQHPTPSHMEDIQILVINILTSILHSHKSIKYLNPILSRHEHFIYLMAGEQMSKDKALSFFIFSVLGKMLAPFYASCPTAVKSIWLIMRMISDTQTEEHAEFLNRETPLGKRAFELLEQINKRLVTTPQIDHYILYLLNQHFQKLANLPSFTPREEIVVNWLLKNSRPMYGLEQKMAHIIFGEFKNSEYFFEINK